MFYLHRQLGYVAALGVNAAGRAITSRPTPCGAILGQLSGKIFSALVLVSIFSAANGVMLTAPRLYYSMARDGIFFAAPGARASALRDAGVGDRVARGLVRPARGERNVRATAHLRRLHRLDLLRTRRNEHFRIAAKARPIAARRSDARAIR